MPDQTQSAGVARSCGTCRWFDRFSNTSVKGVCRRDHRYWRVSSHANRPGMGTALLDSFGAEEMNEKDVCGAHQTGDEADTASPAPEVGR